MRLLVVPTALVGIATFATSLAASPPVKVSLRTSWNSSNLLTEILETVALEEPRSFFPLLDLLTDPATFEFPLVTESPQNLYTKFLNAIKKRHYLKEPGALASFERSLALHAASPKIEAFHSFYAQKRDLNSFQEKHDAVHCPTWVDWYGRRICSPSDLVQALGYECKNWLSWHGHQVCAVDEFVPLKDHRFENVSRRQPKLLSFDHVNPPPADSLTSPPRTAILYASLESPNFYSLHHILYRLSNKTPAPIQYVLRHVPPSPAMLPVPSYLTGYGVALDLKKMEYLAIDDRRMQQSSEESATFQASGDGKSTAADPILSQLPEAEADTLVGTLSTVKLTTQEIQQLGVKASQLILKSSNPLETLERLSQNFPMYANDLSRRLTKDSEGWDKNIVDTITANQHIFVAGSNAVWLNGNFLSKEDLNPFALLRLLRKERRTVLGLSNLGMKVSDAVKLLTANNKVERASLAAIEGLFDASDRPEGGELIAWFNDLEKDERYARWTPQLHALFQASFQLPSIRRNLFNVICALDLSQRSSWNMIATLSNIIQRGFPMHIGVIPIVENEEAAKATRVFYFLMKHYDLTKALNTFTKNHNPQRKLIDLVLLKAMFNELVAFNAPKGEVEEEIVIDFDVIASGGFEEKIKKLPDYHKRLSTTLDISETGHGFVNGRYFPIDESFLQHVQTTMNQHTRFLQEELYYGNIHNPEIQDMSLFFYDLPTTFKRRNPHILPNKGALSIYSIPDLASRNGIPETARFIYPDGESKTPLSIWIVGDFDSPSAVNLFKDALSMMDSDCQYRLAFIHVPSPESTETFTSAALYVLAHGNALEGTTPQDLLKLVNILYPAPANEEELDAANQLLDELLGVGAAETLSYSVEFKEAVKGNQLFARQIGLELGATAIVINGRVVGPIKEGTFGAEDFKALCEYELKQRVNTVREVLEDIHFPPSVDRATHAHIVAMASSIISADQVPDPTQEGLFDKATTPRNRPYQQLQTQNAAFEIGNNQTALFHFGVLLDPLSTAAQSWSSLLKWLADTELVHIVVYLNPAVPDEGASELPLKRFFRYNLQTRLAFEEEEFGVITKPGVEFQNLPVDPIYTLAMDVPQSWLARPRESLHDLDNIHLASLMGHERHEGVQAIFSLDYLVVEGHARDTVLRTSVRGLQLQLLANNQTPVADTLVVDNLGYLQFKATPGVFQLDTCPGRGSDIFQIESAGNEGWHSPTVEQTGTDVSVVSFEGLTIYPRFTRRTGMDKEDVLDDTEPLSGFAGFVNKFGSLFYSKPAAPAVKQQAEINIFTVASGLLYERFASIMILSVLKNTKSTVKFWFIENFLSPSFLEFIPHFAEAHGFEYELVTYKWPSWLRMPTEKQRIIWGYKILFLDVLFPMDLKKVIFVDADQIVRADLKELVDLDLHGAPYGYTPMGDDSHDMDGFRFWKTGYWKDHLKGLPYHISALYVVDLARFRQLAAGDKLRSHYQALSSDPNSLSNLDQDLPNNIQKDVPIFSLPEDWLWCETWCSKDRLHRAKTIDLCQNPKTKEPKLARARQIPEWEEYDQQIANFARKLAESGKIAATAATRDVNALAGEKKAQPADAGQVVLEAPRAEGEHVAEAGDDKGAHGQRDEL